MRHIYDDDGKALSGLFSDAEPLNDYDDTDKDTAWDRSTSLTDRDAIFTGEATINRELQQKQLNAAFGF